MHGITFSLHPHGAPVFPGCQTAIPPLDWLSQPQSTPCGLWGFVQDFLKPKRFCFVGVILLPCAVRNRTVRLGGTIPASYVRKPSLQRKSRQCPRSLERMAGLEPTSCKRGARLAQLHPFVHIPVWCRSFPAVSPRYLDMVLIRSASGFLSVRMYFLPSHMA